MDGLPGWALATRGVGVVGRGLKLGRNLKIRRRSVVLALLLALAGYLAWVWWPRPLGLIVYGATPQGVAAAVAARESGVPVLLIEPGPEVGGVLTRAWLATLDVSEDEWGRPIMGNVFSRLYRALGHDNSFDVGAARAELHDLLDRAHVPLLTGTRLVGLSTQGGRVTALKVRGPSGLREWRAPLVIDATDTADLAARAGASFTLGRADGGMDDAQMAATIVFRVRGANWAALGRAIADENGRLQNGAQLIGRSLAGLAEVARGYTPSDPARFALRGLNAARQDDGSLLVNALLIFGVDGTSDAQVRAARAAGAREARRVVAYLRRTMPEAFGQAEFGGVAPGLYVRETRHLNGELRLRADDVLYGRSTPDSVALNAYPLDGQLYQPGNAPYLMGRPGVYGVPLRTLLPRGWHNLLVVSQAASFDSAAAYSARVVPLQMALGEAAGVAARLAGRRGDSFRAVANDPDAVQRLRTQLEWRGSPVQPGPLAAWPCEDAQNPYAAAARSLLRRGLMSAPYYHHACLHLGAGASTVELINDLQHQWTGRRPDPERRAAFKRLRRQFRRPEPLTVERLETILAPFGGVPAGFALPAGPQTVLTRGEVVGLRLAMAAPADQRLQWVRQDRRPTGE